MLIPPPMALPACTLAATLLLAAAPAPRAQDGVGLEVVRSYFAICDRDANGWVSYREARDSLEIDRLAFARLDRDRDGRVDFEEFRAHYAAVAERLGALPIPRREEEIGRDLPRQPSQILAAYDADGSGALEESELSALIRDYGRAKLPVETALQNLDQDGDARLRGNELELLSRLLATLHVIGGRREPQVEPPRSIDELFGTVVPRALAVDAPTRPPLIVGPVSHFRRLDLDGDGHVELRDLEDLMRPRSSPVSLAALFATLDANEDGLLDRSELADVLGMAR